VRTRDGLRLPAPCPDGARRGRMTRGQRAVELRATEPLAHQLRPEVFEPFLEHHPDDAKHRENALAW